MNNNKRTLQRIESELTRLDRRVCEIREATSRNLVFDPEDSAVFECLSEELSR